MDGISATVFSSLVLSFFIWLCIYMLNSRRISRAPPGPYKFPIIGNLHQIGENPHQSFAKLSKKYGPLMSVKLGSKEMVVGSSAAIAREVLQRNDLICSSRKLPDAIRSADDDYHKFSVLWLPVSSKWQNIRRMYREKVFGTQTLNASRELRQGKIKELVEYVHRCSDGRETVDIGEATFTTSLNLMSRTLFSMDFGNYDSNLSQELKEVVWGVMKNISTPNVSDYFPVLWLIDPQGLARGTRLYFGKLFKIFDGIIEERLLIREASTEPKKNDLLEALLDDSVKNESQFRPNVLKYLLLDLFVGGTDTSAVAVEWAMTELLRNPEKMEKAGAELKEVIGGEKGELVEESDISRLPYLQAIVKETLRLHPVVPLLGPHKADEDVEINGYIVPKDTEILINVWASGRDEETWTNPEMFMPERFLESEIDVKGQHFELIPFGSGRRMCPGRPLAYIMVHLMLASLIHNIDWKLEGGIKPQDLDMEEKFGLSVQKAQPLKAIPVRL